MASEKDKKDQSKPSSEPKGEGKVLDAKAKEAKAAAMKREGAKTKGPAKMAMEDGSEGDGAPRVEPRLQTRYKQHVRQVLTEKHGVKNPMQQPRLEKIVINVNMGRHLEGTKIPANVRTTVLDTIMKIAGQKPVVTLAKKSVSNFKVREGLETAAMVTLRRDRMWHFLDRLVNLACPRIKDFRGLNPNGFDPQGNYAMGLTEQGVFPEINMADVTFTHGMNINFVFSRSTPDLSRAVLSELGFPFRKPEEKPARKTS
jgi:large subunit ribosomal protein L5